MSKHAILEIMARNWFQPVKEGKPFVWHFEEDIQSLPEKNLAELVELYLEALGESQRLAKKDYQKMKTLKSGKIIGIGRTDVSIRELVKFLHALTLAEYEYSKGSIVLNPPEIRTRRLNELAEDVGISVERLRYLFSMWDLELREKISSKSNQKNEEIEE